MLSPHLSYEYDRSFKERVIHFRNYNQLLPWVGIEYSTIDHKRLLVIGESHYLPKKSTVHNTLDWYATAKELTHKEKSWLSTRGAVSCGIDQKYGHKGKLIFSNVEKAILKTNFKPLNKENLFRYFSYYNFFQRPAEERISIEETTTDLNFAFETFNIVTDILKPELVCFVSVKAYKAFMNKKDKDYDFIIDYFPHPARAWWNKESKAYKFGGVNNLKGKEKFKRFINTYFLN